MHGPVRLVHFQVESFCDRIPTSVDTPQPCPDPLLHRCIDTVGYNERWFSNDMKDTEALLFAANVQGIGSIKIFLAPERERERERSGSASTGLDQKAIQHVRLEPLTCPRDRRAGRCLIPHHLRGRSSTRSGVRRVLMTVSGLRIPHLDHDLPSRRDDTSSRPYFDRQVINYIRFDGLNLRRQAIPVS